MQANTLRPSLSIHLNLHALSLLKVQAHGRDWFCPGRITIQILQSFPADAARVLHSFSHSTPSLRVVKESLRGVFFSAAWPVDALSQFLEWHQENQHRGEFRAYFDFEDPPGVPTGEAILAMPRFWYR